MTTTQIAPYQLLSILNFDHSSFFKKEIQTYNLYENFYFLRILYNMAL